MSRFSNGFVARILKLVPLAFLPALIMASGCGGSSEPNNIISGKVMLKGEPVTGSITFHKDGKKSEGPILNGTYSVSNPPIGVCQITIETLGTPVKGAAGGPALETKGTAGAALPAATVKASAPVPAKYGDPTTSGLSHTVKAGKNTHNIDIE